MGLVINVLKGTEDSAHCPDAGDMLYDFGTTFYSTTRLVEILLESVHILWHILYVNMGVCFILSLSDEELKKYYHQSERKSRQPKQKQKGPTKCPVEGCRRVVVKLWNHLQKYHVKHGLTDEFILYCVDCI